ncbi:helix-turn-helix domain-containing protein [Hymenobacter terrenus]|uniref:helix-turn-helix domain-containing protein n=1 Tax=Hymenobacter terrenus TaxID=1629124 RepID=UPI0006195868|nr:helix-turn-helix domain-containing protein [Hymenobacter terrenus]
MKAIPSTSTAAAVRAYFGLSQAALAQFLGVTRGQVAHVEAGRRGLNRADNHRLNQLADLLPPSLTDEASVPATPAETPALPEPLDPHPLRRRQRRCTWRATNLRYDLAKLDARADVARRWQQVLPGLLAALPTDPANAAAQRTRRWLTTQATEAAAELDGTTATTRVLLRLRIEHLEAEAAQLTQLLASLAQS